MEPLGESPGRALAGRTPSQCLSDEGINGEIGHPLGRPSKLAQTESIIHPQMSNCHSHRRQANVLLLYQDSTKLATRLDQAREEIIFPTKFTFQRYQAAMKGEESSTLGESKAKRKKRYVCL
jgi:hypothetical protein